jgi:hypothetical protein
MVQDNTNNNTNNTNNNTNNKEEEIYQNDETDDSGLIIDIEQLIARSENIENIKKLEKIRQNNI